MANIARVREMLEEKLRVEARGDERADAVIPMGQLSVAYPVTAKGGAGRICRRRGDIQIRSRTRVALEHFQTQAPEPELNSLFHGRRTGPDSEAAKSANREFVPWYRRPSGHAGQLPVTRPKCFRCTQDQELRVRHAMCTGRNPPSSLTP